MDPMDPMGHAIIDYSIYDAKRAGFGKVVFVIKKAIEKDFKETVGARVPEGMEVCYAYQEVDALPEGYNVPEGRVKPWGTAHAVLCAKPFINEPFAVINADDYYGVDGYKVMADFGEGFDNVFFGIGHIMQLHGDGVFVVLQGDDRFVHSRLYVLGRVRHVFEQQ